MKRGLKTIAAKALKLSSGLVRLDAKTAIAMAIPAAALLSLLLYPATWSLALPWLEKAVPPPIFDAIHEFRHILGIPCH